MAIATYVPQSARQMMTASADLVDVGICAHNQRALATTLQGHMLHVGCCICQNLLAHHCAPCKGHLHAWQKCTNGAHLDMPSWAK